MSPPGFVAVDYSTPKYHSYFICVLIQNLSFYANVDERDKLGQRQAIDDIFLNHPSQIVIHSNTQQSEYGQT